MDELNEALGEAYTTIDYDEFLQVMKADGEHVGLITTDFVVQLDLSVILVLEGDDHDEDALYALAERADDLLRAEVAPTFQEVGFGVSESGALQAAEAEETEEVVISYELPTFTQAEDAAMVRQVLDWALDQQREFFLFSVDGELVPALPVEG